MKSILLFTLITSSLFCSGQVIRSSPDGFFYYSSPTPQPTKQFDTVRVIMLLSDTSIIRSPAYWSYGYSVRKLIPEGWYNDMFQSWYWEHVFFLNEYTKPITKNIIIWQTK